MSNIIVWFREGPVQLLQRGAFTGGYSSSDSSEAYPSSYHHGYSS